MSNPELRKARYWARKENHLCVDCGAGLQEEDGLQCVECREAAYLRALRYVHSEKGKQRSVETQRERRARLRAAGVCVSCGGILAAESVLLCVHHLDARRQHQAARRDRQRHGISVSRGVIVDLARKPAADYRPLDELKSKPRVRILLQLSWLDWTAPLELFTALNVDMSDGNSSTERNTYDTTLARLVRLGLAERRRIGAGHEYRITSAGRAEVARMRAGDFTTRRAA